LTCMHKPVMVLAPVDMLILSVENNGNPDSDIRGGRYIWALDPLRDRIIYFAHLNEIRAASGTFFRAARGRGDKVSRRSQPKPCVILSHRIDKGRDLSTFAINPNICWFKTNAGVIYLQTGLAARG